MVKDSSVSIWVRDFVFHEIERSQSETMAAGHDGMVLPFANAIVIYSNHSQSFGGSFYDSVQIVLDLTTKQIA